jgi:hypothetical protein
MMVEDDWEQRVTAEQHCCYQRMRQLLYASGMSATQITAVHVLTIAVRS